MTYKVAVKTIFLLFFLFPLITLSANSIKDRFLWSFSGSLFYFAADNGVDSDPAPILPNLGFSVSLHVWGPLRIELTEDIYFTNYEWNLQRGYPMACNPENRSAFVLGFFTGLQLVGVIPLGENGITVRVYGGPAADLRLVTMAFGLNHPMDHTGNIETRDPGKETEAIRSYFWGSGRWFMPVIGAGMDFPISDRFLLGFDIRVWFPMYKLWTDDDTPVIDGWRFGAGFRITPRRSSV